MDSRCLDLQSLRAVLGGDIAGRQILCPGPGHSRKDRSLAVRPTATGFIVHSFANDDWRACRDYVHQHLGLPSWQPTSPHQTTTKWTTDCAERPKAIWAEAQDPRGTLAEDYLAARKLDLPAELCGKVLRYHPRCPWQCEHIPCLVAAFKSFRDDEVTGVHRVRLDQPARWPKVERKMLGTVAGSAIKLDPPGQRLAIGEGLETCMAARQLGFGGVWALGSARRFEPIDGVSELVILGECDAASSKASAACARLWTDQGRAVYLALPARGSDFNDILLEAR